MFSAFVFAAALAADPSGACGASPSQPAVVLPIDLMSRSSEGNQILVSATIVLEAAQVDAAHARAADEPCALGSFRAAGAQWSLTGGHEGYVRRALAADPDKAAAFLYPVVDVPAALEASNGKGPQPPTRYLLVTAKGTVDTLWRAYFDPPSDAQLRADLTEALEGRAAPAADLDLLTHKVNVYVPHKR